MLRQREWQPRMFQTLPRSSSYAFLLVEPTATMTACAASSMDFDMLFPTDQNFEWVTPDQQVARVLVELFREIREVKSVCAQFTDDEIVVWTLLESYNRDAREKVYEKELEACRLMRITNFDFRVTSEDLVPAQELVAGGSREIYRRD